jgi:O-antigen/teichoic acid export membrane protein
VAGPGFEPSVAVLRILSLAMITTFLVATFAFALLSLRLHRALLVANGIAVVIATVATLVLVPLDGARGGAIAPIAAEGCLALAYATALFRARSDLRVSLSVVPRVLAAAALAVAVAVVTPLPAAALIPIATVVYFGVLFLLKGIPPEILHAVWRRAPGAA